MLALLDVSHSRAEKAGATTMVVDGKKEKEARKGAVPSTRHPLSGFVENRRRDGAGPD